MDNTTGHLDPSTLVAPHAVHCQRWYFLPPRKDFPIRLIFVQLHLGHFICTYYHTQNYLSTVLFRQTLPRQNLDYVPEIGIGYVSPVKFVVKLLQKLHNIVLNKYHRMLTIDARPCGSSTSQPSKFVVLTQGSPTSSQLGGQERITVEIIDEFR